MRQVRIQYKAGQDSPVRYFKEWVDGRAGWTFIVLRGSLYNEADAAKEIERLKAAGFSFCEVISGEVDMTKEEYKILAAGQARLEAEFGDKAYEVSGQ